MASIVQSFIIAAAIVTACGQSVSVTNSSESNYLISQRGELLNEIEIVELQIDSVNARYADRLDVIQSQQQQLLKEIVQTNRTLMHSETLSLVRKQCIKKYDTQLVTYDNATYQMKVCYDRAAAISSTLTAYAQSNVVLAKNQVIYTLADKISNCDKLYSKNDSLLQDCYVIYVDLESININNYLSTARIQLNQTSDHSSFQLRMAVQCSFAVKTDILETIGKTTKTIDDCEVALNKQKSVAVLSSTGPKNAQGLIMGKITGQ